MAASPVLNRLRFLAQMIPGGQPALRDSHGQLNYPDLVLRVDTIARQLREIECSVIAFAGDNSINWVLMDLACQVAEKVFVPLPGFFTPAQIAHCIEAAQVGLVLTDTEEPDTDLLARTSGPFNTITLAFGSGQILRGRQLPARVGGQTVFPRQTGKITFTSGSTGTPKGVCLSTAHQWLVAESLADRIEMRHPAHICLLPLPTLLENVAGVYTALLSGGTVVLPSAAARGISGSSGLNLPALLDCLEENTPNSLILIPQLLSALVHAGRQGWRPPSSLQFLAVGGARVSPRLILEARNLGLPVYEGYGLSECGSVVTLNTPAGDLPGSTGRPLAHCQVEIAGGAIRVSGSCHLGYLQEPDSWYPQVIDTGDLGHLDGAGYLKVEGRRSNLLITSFGRNVSPEWVESTLLARPLFSHCVVLGDGRATLTAILSAPASVSDTAIAQRLDEANQQLPDYARVQHWLRVPISEWTGLLTGNGRPQRQAINRHFAGRIEQLYHVTEPVPSMAS